MYVCDFKKSRPLSETSTLKYRPPTSFDNPQSKHPTVSPLPVASKSHLISSSEQDRKSISRRQSSWLVLLLLLRRHFTTILYLSSRRLINCDSSLPTQRNDQSLRFYLVLSISSFLHFSSRRHCPFSRCKVTSLVTHTTTGLAWPGHHR